MVDRVQEALDRVSPAASETTQVEKWVNEVIREDISRAHDWKYLEAEDDLVTVADQDVYILTNQDVFKDIRFILFRKTTTDEWRELDPTPDRVLFQKFTVQAATEPRLFSHIGSSGSHAIRIRGIPSTSGWFLKVFVTRFPAVLTGTNTNIILEQWPRLIECGAMKRGALQFGNLELHTLWTANFNQELTNAIRSERSKDGDSHPTLRMSPAAGRPSSGLRRAQAHRGPAYDWNA
jgi:hypothetical protein